MINSYPHSLSVWHPSYPVQHLPISEQPTGVLHALHTFRLSTGDSWSAANEWASLSSPRTSQLDESWTMSHLVLAPIIYPQYLYCLLMCGLFSCLHCFFLIIIPPISWHTHVPLSYFSTLVHYKYLYSFSTIFVQFFCSSENAYNVIYILYVHFSSTMCQVIIWFWGYNNE